MALTSERSPAVLPASVDAGIPTGQSTRRAALWLLVVAAAYVTTMLVVVAPRVALGWDESLYASQVSPRAPADFFSAPRARGVTYLIAPVVHVTASTVALRTYLAVLAGVLLVAGFWPWLRVFRRPVTVPLAAVAFSGLWVVLFYSPSAMPNSWVALGALATVGWFVRYGYGASRWSLAGVGVGLAFVALVRPSDAFWLCLPLVVTMLVSRRWRRLPLYGAVPAGAAVGLTPWLVESYQRFGGPVARLHRASQIEGGLAWHPIGAYYQMRSTAGPLLCRPCTGQLAHPLFAVWWLALPVLVVLGVVVAGRAGELAAAAVPAAAGASIGLSYLLTLPYAAPRFLIPAYALLALPVGVLLSRLVRVPGRIRIPVAVVTGLVITLQVTSQLTLLVHEASTYTTRARGYGPAATVLRRDGVHTPCTISGTDAVPIGYALGCRAEAWHGHNKTTTKAGLLAMARHHDAVYISHEVKPPAYLHSWKRHPLPTPPGEHHWFAYTPPWEPTT